MLGRGACLAEVVGHGLLAQHVLAALERRARQLVVRVRRRDDVDDVDVGARDQRLPVVGRLGDAEVGGVRLGALAVDVADGDDLAARVALPAGNVGMRAQAPAPRTATRSLSGMVNTLGSCPPDCAGAHR